MDDRTQRLYELTSENFEINNKLSDNFTLIEIITFKGKSTKTKKLLYAEMFKNLLNNPGIKGKNILILLNEQPFENWGISGKPANELDLGFNVRV